jgi:hypothetical protein
MSASAAAGASMDEGPEHRHTYSFLRQEETPIQQWAERVDEWLIQDVFFCTGCLDEVRKDVRREVPSRSRFGRDVVWRSGS